MNIPWNLISVDMAGTFAVDAEAETLATILKDQFGAHLSNGQWDFRNAKTLVLFCNGLWCPQSGNNIKTLIRLGYPTYKLKWYRGGMPGLGQCWFDHCQSLIGIRLEKATRPALSVGFFSVRRMRMRVCR